LFPAEGAELSTAVAFVEAIPAAYAEQLGDFADQQIFAKVSFYGTTTGEKDYDVPPFQYPITLCDGCLVACRSSFPDSSSQAEIYGSDCPDDAAADGRICFDPDC